MGANPVDERFGTPEDPRLEVVAVIPEDVHYSAREALEVVPSTLIGSVYHYAKEKVIGAEKGVVVRELNPETLRLVSTAYEE